MCTLTSGCLEEPPWAFTHAAMHFQLIQTMISWRLSKEPTLKNREPPEAYRYVLQGRYNVLKTEGAMQKLGGKILKRPDF